MPAWLLAGAGFLVAAVRFRQGAAWWRLAAIDGVRSGPGGYVPGVCGPAMGAGDTRSGTLVRRYPVLTYFGLAFAISWAGCALTAGPKFLWGELLHALDQAPPERAGVPMRTAPEAVKRHTVVMRSPPAQTDGQEPW